MPPRSHIEKLPKAVRQWLDNALTDNNFSGYRQLEDILRNKGYAIGRAQISRYGQKVQQRFNAIREATEMARIITEGAPDDQDKRSEAIIATIQTDILSCLVDLRLSQDDDREPAARAALLAKVGKSIGTLTRSSVTLKRFQADIKDKIAQKMDDLEREAATGADNRISLDTLRRVREEIYGIVQS